MVKYSDKYNNKILKVLLLVVAGREMVVVMEGDGGWWLVGRELVVGREG